MPINVSKNIKSNEFEQLSFDLITKELMNNKEEIEKFRVALKQLTLSSLFTTASKKQSRERYSRKEIITFDNKIEITYSGDELRTDDEDVFMCILTLASDQKICAENSFMISTTHYKLLKMLKWPLTLDYYDKLDIILDRFVACSLTVKIRNKNLKMSILTHTYGTGDAEGRAGKLQIFLSPHMQTLFTKQNITLIDSIKREKLSAISKKISTILDEFSTSRAELTVELIYEISGSTAKFANFKKMLTRSLKEMKRLEMIKDFVITKNNIIYIEK